MRPWRRKTTFIERLAMEEAAKLRAREGALVIDQLEAEVQKLSGTLLRVMRERDRARLEARLWMLKAGELWEAVDELRGRLNEAGSSRETAQEGW